MSEELQAIEYVLSKIHCKSQKETEELKKHINVLVKIYNKSVVVVKPTVYEDLSAFECSKCIANGETDSMWLFSIRGEYDYCPRCGSKLDWEEMNG